MTVTLPPASTPAARRVAARAAATWRSVVTAALAVVLLVLPAAPALATATPSPSPTGLSGEATLTLAPTGNGIVAPGAALSAWVTLDNGTDRPLAERAAVLSLGSSPLADRGDVTAWLSGESEISGIDEVASATIPVVASGDSAATTVRLEPDAAPLQNRGPGVYPLEVRTAGPGGTVTARSVMTVPAATPPATVAVVVPITAGPRTTGLLTSDELAELTAADGQLTGTLDAVTGTTAILAVDPAIAAAIRVLGTSAPETAVQWLDRLLRLPNERFALQFGDADIAAQLQGGLPALLAPTTLQPYMTASDFPDPETPTAPPTPPATDAPLQPAFPDLAALLDIGSARASTFWPISGTADAGVVSTLGAASADGSPSLTLVPSATTDRGAESAVVPASQRADGAAVLVYDSVVSTSLRDAAGSPDAATRGAPLSAATAYLSLAAGASGPLLVVVDRANDFTRVGLRAAIAAASASDVPVTLDQLAGTATGTVAITGAEPDVDRSTAASQLLGDEGALGTFSSVLDDPSVLLGPERAEMLQVLGAGWYARPEAWSSAVAAHRAATATTLDAVGILPPTDTNLLSTGGGLPVWVRNDLQWPVTVVLNANPDDVRLEMDATTEVRADAASNTRIGVPVRAQRGNGQVTVALQLHSPTGIPIGGRQQVDVNVQPDWEGVGIVILSVLVGGLIVLGVVRTVLHRRWVKRQAETA